MTRCSEDFHTFPLVEASLLEQFNIHVKTIPQQIAVQDASRKVTFEDLDDFSSSFAGYLRSLGLGKSTTPERYDIDHPDQADPSPWVIIHTERTVDVIVGILAVLRAGGAYICVPSNAPDEYIAQIAQTSHATTILTDNPHKMYIHKTPCICLSDKAIIQDINPEYIRAAKSFIPAPEDIAVAIFTSGSTGIPKGAVLEHKALSSILAWQQSYMKLRQGAHTAAFAPFGFVASLWELLYPLAAGHTLHILDESTRKDPIALEGYFNQHKIEYVFLSAEMAELFSHNCKSNTLKYVRVAGSPLRSCAQNSYEILYSLGMSENGGSVTFLPIKAAYESNIPLGGAFGSSCIYLLDRENRAVNRGEVGVMAVSSPHLARGYLGLPAETNRCFVSNPLAPSDAVLRNRNLAKSTCNHERLFISGDVARVDPNGMLIYCGRNDFVVKIRGMRVDPSHVEAVISSCGKVAECVVIAQTDHNHTSVLCAWAAGAGLDEETLRAYVKVNLPEYMVPEHIRIVESLPRGVHGKVDRERLPDVSAADNAPSAESQESTIHAYHANPYVTKLCSIFADILERTKVAPNDNFFALGGDSIKLVRLQLTLRKVFSVDLQYGQLFREPTAMAIAAMLVESCMSSGISTIPTAQPQSQYPLPSPMRQMYLLWRLGTDQRLYEVDTCFLLEGAVDCARLEASFSRLVKLEPLLRSRFIEQGGEPALVIDDVVSYSFETHHAAGLEEARQHWEALSLNRPSLNLRKAPLFYVAHIKIDATRSFVGLTVHHILVDAASSRLLVDAWWDLYRVGEIHSPGQNQTASMTDYILWNESRQDSPALQASHAWWKDHLGYLPPALDLTGSTVPRPPALSGGSSIARTTLEKADLSNLRALEDNQSVTIFQILLAIWSAFLARQADTPETFGDFILGVPFIGRDHPALQYCMGMFVRVLPLRFHPEPNGQQTFSDWLSCTRELFLNVWNHQGCSLEKIVQLVNPPRMPGRNPLFDVMINLLPRPRGFAAHVENGMTTCRIVPGFQRPTSMFDLVLEIKEGEDRIFLELKYANDLFHADLMHAWVASLAEITRVAVSNPQIRLCDLPWLLSPQIVDLKTSDIPDSACEAAESTFTREWPPETPEALALISAWKKLLHAQSVGPNDNFFDSGGDSITAMKLEAELFEHGWYLPANSIYDVARLADLIALIVPDDDNGDEEDDFA